MTHAYLAETRGAQHVSSILRRVDGPSVRIEDEEIPDHTSAEVANENLQAIRGLMGSLPEGERNVVSG